MAVVAITGILAALGIAALRRNVEESNTGTAIVVVKSIAVAEEQYRAVNQVYLDVSTEWYPQAVVPKNHKISFWRDPGDAGGGDPETQRWRELRPDIRQPVDFVFKANAGLPSDPPPQLPAGTVTLPAVLTEPWYVIQAMADADGDSTPCIVAAASWNPEVVTANAGE